MIKMTITLEIDNSKINLTDFRELEKQVYEIAMAAGRMIISQTLQAMDGILQAERDKERYRCKGGRKTCIKTRLGAVEYSRNVYEDRAAVEHGRYVYLLDEVLEVNRIGLVSEEVCRVIASSICESTYRETSRQLTETMGISMSPQGVWNIVQQLGQGQEALIERHAELAKANHSLGEFETKLLYEEHDGIWLHLQGASRQENGPSKEMKMGIAYDGVIWKQSGKTGKRWELDRKLAYACFAGVKDYRRNKEAVIASRYDVDGIELRVVNGDGANWIQKTTTTNTICVLDEYHRNKKLTECVRDPEFAKLLREKLYAGEYQLVVDMIEAQMNSVADEKEKEKLAELHCYYTDNFEALPGYFERGIPIPDTRDPENVHHARLGSMESNVFTLIGNRMKDGRACWSIQGANNLALLLCARHTVGFEDLFAMLPPLPQPEPEYIDTLPVLGAGKIAKSEGHGYENPYNFTVSNADSFVSNFIHQLSLNNSNF